MKFFQLISKQHGKARREFADSQVASVLISITALSSRLSTRTVLVITAKNGSAFDGLTTPNFVKSEGKTKIPFFDWAAWENLTTREELKNASRFGVTTNGTTSHAKTSVQLAADSSMFDIAEISHLD